MSVWGNGTLRRSVEGRWLGEVTIRRSSDVFERHFSFEWKFRRDTARSAQVLAAQQSHRIIDYKGLLVITFLRCHLPAASARHMINDSTLP